MSRLLLAPLFFMCLYYWMAYPIDYAFMRWWCRGILLYILISDFFDGYLARALGNVTTFGSLLDPLADKLFVISTYVLLSVFDKTSAWLTIVIVSKDILVTIGWIASALLFDKTEVQPSGIGKAATAMQFFTVFIIVMLPAAGIPKSILEFLTGMLTLFAMSHYVYLGLQLTMDQKQ